MDIQSHNKAKLLGNILVDSCINSGSAVTLMQSFVGYQLVLEIQRSHLETTCLMSAGLSNGTTYTSNLGYF